MRVQALFRVLFALLSLVLVPADATELAPLTSAELGELCGVYLESPESDQGRACSAYVRGFIEGSTKVVVREDSEIRSESFSERAWRTRLGIRSLPVPEYCVEKAISLRDFVVQLLEQAEHKPPAAEESASALLYATLSRFHRCSQ
jgi:hypothetical protein